MNYFNKMESFLRKTLSRKRSSSVLNLVCKQTVIFNKEVNLFQSRFHSSGIKSTDSYSSTEPRHWSEIPTLKSYPIIGHRFSMLLHKDFNKNKMHVLIKSLTNELGPIFRLHPWGVPPMLMMTDPNDFEVMFRSTMENPIRNIFHVLRKVRKEAAFFEEKGGLLTENDEEWKRLRNKVSTPMLRPKNIAKYLTKMDEVSLDFMERIGDLQRMHGEMPETFQNELHKWALESVGLVALNRRLGCLSSNLAPDSFQMTLIKVVNDLFSIMNELEMSISPWRVFPTPKFRKFRNGHNLFLRIAREAIAEAEAALSAKGSCSEDQDLTLMETLLKTDGLSRRDVVTMIMDMLFAGIDTTSHSVAYTLYLLARNPRVQEKLHKEVDTVLGGELGSITEKHLAALSYLKACVKESMRLFPVVLGATRVLDQEVIFSGYKIPKGWQATNVNFITCQNETYFKRANEYLPERWARDQPLGPIHPFASLPFSYGPRMCIGRRIAEQELYLFLARVIQRFSIDYKYNDMDMITRIICVPSEPLKFEFKERNK